MKFNRKMKIKTNEEVVEVAKVLNTHADQIQRIAENLGSVNLSINSDNKRLASYTKNAVIHCKAALDQVKFMVTEIDKSVSDDTRKEKEHIEHQEIVNAKVAKTKEENAAKKAV